MPEKSGMDAALCGPILACPAAGSACCPTAGLAVAANVTNNSKFRCTFMATSRHGLPRPRAGAGAVDILSQMRERRTTEPRLSRERRRGCPNADSAVWDERQNASEDAASDRRE